MPFPVTNKKLVTIYASWNYTIQIIAIVHETLIEHIAMYVESNIIKEKLNIAACALRSP
jgi:hypothetical protein